MPSQVPPFTFQNKRFEGNKLFLNSHSSERGFSILEFAKDSIHTKSDTIKILYDKKNKLKLSYTLANSKKVTIQKGTTEIDINQIPNKLSFDPAFPNPFNPLTTFSFNLPEAMNSNVILLQIYDIKGRSVETLIERPMSPGQHNIKWNASQFSSGVYFVKLNYNNQSQTQKLILLK